jgi:hypothetical protein
MATTIHIFADRATSVPTLSSAKISGFTPDGGNDKDNDTQISFTLFVDYGGGFTQTVAHVAPQTYGRFPDGKPWGPIDIPVSGTFSIDGVSRLKGAMEFQPNGDDTWKFNYKLDLVFSDGTVLTKTGDGLSASDSARRVNLWLDPNSGRRAMPGIQRSIDGAVSFGRGAERARRPGPLAPWSKERRRLEPPRDRAAQRFEKSAPCRARALAADRRFGREGSATQPRVSACGLGGFEGPSDGQASVVQ